MLVEHRVDDVDEGFVAVEQAVAAGQQVAFQPAFALVLAQHFHDATGTMPGGRRPARSIVSHCRGGGFEQGAQAVRHRLVRAEHAEVAPRHRSRGSLRAATGPSTRVSPAACVPGRRNLRGVVSDSPEASAVSAASPPFACGLAPMRRVPLGGEGGDIRLQAALLVEQFLRPIAAHPRFELRAMGRVLARLGQRHLVRAERAFDAHAVHFARARSNPWGWPARSTASAHRYHGLSAGAQRPGSRGSRPAFRRARPPSRRA